MDALPKVDSRAFAQMVADLVPVMLAYWDTSQRCVFANRAYERWFGVSPESLVGKTLKELLGPIYPLNRPYIEGALRGEPQEFEREIPDPAGGPPRYALAHYIPHLENGVVKGFAVVVSNITERKLLADELQRALAQVRTLRGLLPICAWCGKVRDDTGYWNNLEEYVAQHTEAQITHGLCDSCARLNFPNHHPPPRDE